MKTRRPGFKISSARTVAKDLKVVFAADHKQVEELLKVSH
jgi:hypothetical protein